MARNSKRGNKLPKSESKSNRMCLVLGQRMTVAERNLMMKLDYINSGLTIAQVAEKYEMKSDAVYELSRSGKWRQEKKELEEQIEKAAKGKFIEVYARGGAEINLMYNNTWQKIINMCNEALNNPEKYLKNPDGTLKWGALQVLSEIVERAQKGQQFTTGFVGREVAARIEFQAESLLLKRKQMGEDTEDSVVEDNFMEALGVVAEQVWEMKEGNDSASIV